MAEEKLQYSVTFKTRAEGTGAQQTAAAVRDLRTEKERLNALSSVSAQKVGAEAAANYDLSESISRSSAAVKVHYTAAKADDAQRARAIQTTRQLREEEAKRAASLQHLAAAAGTAGTSSRTMGARIQNTAFQVQDLGVQLQMGTSAATAFAQQLPQLLGGFGAGGAIAGGVVALGALAYKLATAGANTEEAKLALGKYNEKLKELIDLKADEAVDAYVLSLTHAAERQRDLQQAEINRLGTAAEVEAADRRKQQAQDDLTLSVLRYQEAVYGVDTSAEAAAIKRQGYEREAQAATDAQNTKLTEARMGYAELGRQIDDLKASTKDYEEQIQSLAVKSAELGTAAKLAGTLNKPGEQGDLDKEKAKVDARLKELQAMVAAAPRQIADITAEAWRAAFQIDEIIQTSAANIDAINAELKAKVGSAEIEETIAQNQKLTGDLGKALEDYQASTPAQAQAAADLTAAVADGRLTTQELAALSGQLLTLGGSFNSTIQGNTRLVDRLLSEVESLAAAQKAQEARIEGLKNRR